MKKQVEAYKLGEITVTISETSQEGKLHVDCSDGAYHSEFTIKRYEYENYKRHMNQRIKNAFDRQHKKEG
jgi:hypothetical protein